MISYPSIQNINAAINRPRKRYNVIAIKCLYLPKNPTNLNRILVEIYLALEEVQVDRLMLGEAHRRDRIRLHQLDQRDDYAPESVEIVHRHLGRLSKRMDFKWA